MDKITAEDRERVELLQRVSSSKDEFKKLTVEQLKRLQELIEKKITVMTKKPTNLR